MPSALHVLLVEDSADDAEFILRELGRRGYEPHWQRVETAPALADALTAQPWDVVLCDYVMPRFSGPEALRQVQAHDADLPVILVSGEVRQEAAVEAMKAGARDYVMKGELARLAPAVERELAEAARRRSERQARAEDEVRLRGLVDDLDAVIWEADPITLECLFVSGRAASLLGYPLEQWRSEPTFWVDHIHADDRERVLVAVRDAVANGRDLSFEYRLITADGRSLWVRQATRVAVDAGGRVTRLRAILVDISARKAADQAMRRRLAGERQVAAVLIRLAAVAAEDVDGCIADALSSIAAIARASRGFVVLTSGEGDAAQATVSHAWNSPGSDAAIPAGLTAPATAPWWWEQLRAQRPLVVLRLADLPPEAHAERALLAGCGVGAIAAMPLHDGGVLRGFLGLSAEGDLLPPRDDLVALLRVVGDVLLGALDRAGAVLGLRDSERRFRELVENLSEVICTVDPQGRLSYASPNLQTYAGVRAEDLVGRPFRDFILPDHRSEVEATFARVLAGERVASELRVRLAPDTERWVRTTSCPLLRDGVVTAIQVVIEDITERKQVEEQRQLLALLTEQAPIGIVQTDAAGQVTAANPVAVDILGSPSPEATARLNVLTVPGLHAVGADALFRAALERRERGSIEARYRSHWGKESFVQLHVAPLFDAAQRVRGTVAVIEDVTPRRLAEQALRDREERQRSLIDGLGSAVLVGLATPDGRLIEASRSALELTGMRIEEVRGVHVADLPPFLHSEPLRAGLREAVQRAVEGVATRFDVALRIGPEDERTLDFHVQPLRGAGGEVVYIIGTGVDITDRHRAQRDLARLNDELERRVIERTTQLAVANSELEAFTSSVSHDLRSPLRAIQGFSHSLLEEEDGQLAEPARRDVERIRAAATRMQQLIDALLELARVSHGALQRHAVDLSQLAATQAAELQRADPHRRVTVTIADGMMAQGDARLLQVVLANLLDNAWKYTATRAQARIEVAVEVVDGERAYVVRDDGVGFDPNAAAQLFEPFRRLHGAEFAGSGVGLATVARIVERHGGRIWATAEPDRGAAFFFTLGAAES